MNEQASIIRWYNQVQIKEGQDANFIALVDPFVEITSREAGNVQVQAFYHEATSKMVWWETYRNVEGLMAHFSNPEGQEMGPKIFPLVELEPIRIMGSLPDEVKAGLLEAGFPIEFGEAYAATSRLHTAKDGQPALQINFEADISDVNALPQIATLMTDDLANMPGVLFNGFYPMDGNRLIVHQAFVDQDAFLEWSRSDASTAIAEQLGTLASNVIVEVFGDVDGDAKAYLDGWGAKYFKLCGGAMSFAELAAVATAD